MIGKARLSVFFACGRSICLKQFLKMGGEGKKDLKGGIALMGYRYITCVWYRVNGKNIDTATTYRYTKTLAPVPRIATDI
jgi:hypothetical protein